MSVSVVPNKMVVCRQAIKENFSNLSASELNFLIETISSIDPDYVSLARFLLLTNAKLNTGRLAFSFNERVTNAISTRDKVSLLALFNQSIENSFPEFYANHEFNQLEKQTIAHMIEREFSAILNSLKRGNSHIAPQSLKYLPCETDLTRISTSNETVSLYQKCYEDICIQESSNSSNLPLSSTLFNQGNAPTDLYAPDINEKGLSIVRCFKIMSILPDLVNGVVRIAPNKLASNLTVKLLQEKLSKEIKMYRYYLAHKPTK